MGHKSYVSPSIDDDDMSRPIRRKGSDLPLNEETPLTRDHDRKKDVDGKMLWIRNGLKRGGVILILASLCGIIVWGFGNKSSNHDIALPKPIATDVPLIPDEKSEIWSSDVAPRYTIDSLEDMLKQWNLPYEAIEEITLQEWDTLYDEVSKEIQRIQGGSDTATGDEVEGQSMQESTRRLRTYRYLLSQIQDQMSNLQGEIGDDITLTPREEELAPRTVEVALEATKGSVSQSAPTTTVTTTEALTQSEPLTSEPTLQPATTKTNSPATLVVAPVTTENLSPIAGVKSSDELPAPAVTTTTTPPPTPTTSIAPTQSQSTLAPYSPTPALDYQRGLKVWLQANAGVEFIAGCTSESPQCSVKQWKNSVMNSDGAWDFLPINLASPSGFPIWIPRVQNNLPILHFTCPMLASGGALLRDRMTLFFVLSPTHLGDAATKHQRFFGHTPFGQFRFHEKHASFVGTTPVDAQDNEGITTGMFSVITYRLAKTVNIQVNGISSEKRYTFDTTTGMGFGSETQDADVQVSLGNGATTLGNAKSICDDHAFQGRIAEVLVYEDVLNDVAIESIHDYLHRKWSIPRGVRKAQQPHRDPTPPPSLPPIPASNEHIQSTQEQVHNIPTTPSPISPPRGRHTYNRDDVFRWEPPRDADPALIAEWKRTVGEKIRSVELFQFGGQVLYDFIDQLKTELNTLRDSLFG